MAGTVLQELSIVFDARTDKLSKGLGAVKTAVSGTAGSVEGVGKRFDLLAGSISGAVKAAAGMAVVQKSAQYIKDGIADVFDEIEQTTKLTTVMRQRMNATDGAIQRVLDLADAQKQLGVVDDMVLVAGAQQVSTFLNTSAAVETLLPAMGNLLAQQKGLNATTEDAVSIGNMFGKVMQGQTSALTRVGITFTAAQEQVLLYGNELERAQMLSQVVTDNVGQMSSALGGTLQGRLQQLTNILGDVRKGLGEAFTPIVAAVLPPLTALAKALLFVVNCMAKFSAWMAKLFGINIKVASSADGVAGSSADAADAIEKQGAAAGGAAKKTKKLLSTLDQLNEVNKESSGGGGGGGGDKVNDIGAGGAAIDEIADDLADSEASIGELILGAAAWGLAIAGAYRIISPLIRDVLGVFRSIKGAIGGAGDAASVLGDVAQTASSVANTAASTAETAAQTAETAATNAGAAAEGVSAAAETISAATSVLSGLGSLAQALGLAAVAIAAGTAAGQFGKMADKAGAAKDAVEAIDDNADTTFTSLNTAAGTAATGLETAMTGAAGNASTEFGAMGTAGENAMNGVAGRVPGISAAIRDAWMSAKQSFAGIGVDGESAASAVGIAMQGAAARTAGSMQSAANSVYALITALKTIPTNISSTVHLSYTQSGSSARTGGFGGGSSMGSGAGRAFATGTVTRGPQMALIGEAGTEAVVPLEGENARSYARRYPWLIREFAQIWQSAGVQRMENGGIGGVRISRGVSMVSADEAQSVGEEIAVAILRALGGVKLSGGSGESGAPRDVQLSVDGYHLAMTVIGAIHGYEQVSGLQFLLR